MNETLLELQARKGKMAPGYLLIGPAHEVKSAVLRAVSFLIPGFDPESFDPKKYTNFYFFAPPMNIGKAKEIVKKSALKSGQEKIFFIDGEGMTDIAANALLKTMEEAPEGNRFFLRADNRQSVLPTLRSRLILANLPAKQEDSDRICEEFDRKSRTQKINWIKKTADRKENAREEFNRLLCGRELDCERALGEAKTEEELKEVLKKADAILWAREKMTEPASWPKGIFEYLIATEV